MRRRHAPSPGDGRMNDVQRLDYKILDPQHPLIPRWLHMTLRALLNCELISVNSSMVLVSLDPPCPPMRPKADVNDRVQHFRF